MMAWCSPYHVTRETGDGMAPLESADCSLARVQDLIIDDPIAMEDGPRRILLAPALTGESARRRTSGPSVSANP
jgi:hypothetical protein